MRPVGETVGLLEARRARGARRARYARALRAHRRGLAGELRGQPARLTALVGEEVVRVWRLYLVGGALAFRDGRMGVDQILAVRPGASAHPAGGARVVTCSPGRARSLAAVVDGGRRRGQPARRAGLRGRRGLGAGARRDRARRAGRRPDDLALLAARRPGDRVGRPARMAHRRAARAGTARTRATPRCSAGRAASRAARRKVFLTQAVVASAHLAAAAGRRRRTTSAGGPWSWVGCALWAVGVFFEAVGDAQLAAYKARPATGGPDHGPRPVGLDPAPQLLRRRLRVVGPLDRRRRWRGLAAGPAHRVGARRDDVLRAQRDRRQAAGADDVAARGVGRVRRPGAAVRPASPAGPERGPGSPGAGRGVLWA